MTEPKSLGWVGTTTAALVASALPSFLGWLFPSWDALFASSGRTLNAVWEFVTAKWSVPALPLVAVALAVAYLVVWRDARERREREAEGQAKIDEGVRSFVAIQAAERVAAKQSARNFNSAEQSILQQLLHSETNMEDAAEIASQSNAPRLAITAAARKLKESGLIEFRRAGYSDAYSLTDKGKALVLELWNDDQH